MQEKGVLSSKTTLISSNSNDVSYAQRVLWLLNIIYYQILASVTIVLFWIFFKAYALDSTRLWHLVLSTAAFVPLMATAIVLFSKDNLTTIYIPRTKIHTIHGILLSISCAAITAGIAVETDTKRRNNRAHFVSNHAILGLVSWILIFVSVLIGLVAANTRTFSTYIRPVVVKLLHNFLGLASFAIGIASLYLMLSVVQRNASENVYKGVKVGVIYVTIWSSLAALKSLLFQIKDVFT